MALSDYWDHLCHSVREGQQSYVGESPTLKRPVVHQRFPQTSTWEKDPFIPSYNFGLHMNSLVWL